MDETPIFSKRQLVQSLGQFTITFATGLTALLSDGSPLTWQKIATAALQALVVAGGVLGFSKLPPK